MVTRQPLYFYKKDWDTFHNIIDKYNSKSSLRHHDIIKMEISKPNETGEEKKIPQSEETAPFIKRSNEQYKEIKISNRKKRKRAGGDGERQPPEEDSMTEKKRMQTHQETKTTFSKTLKVGVSLKDSLLLKSPES